MAESTDSSLSFFTKANPEQWSYVLSLYKEVLSLKAALRTKKKGGPEELINLDNWYQETLPKEIRARKDPQLTHHELVQVMKWKMMRGKFRPRLTDLVRINTELAVKNITKKAFRKIPNLSLAIQALTTLKGIGPATASAVLAAAFPEHAPYMADESMLSTPGIESTDYTLKEYLNYVEQIQACSERLKKKDPKREWNPHKVELTLWTHYMARELKPALLDDLPSKFDTLTPNSEENANSDASNNSEPIPEHDTPNGKDKDHQQEEESNGASCIENNLPASKEDKSEEPSDESSQEGSKTGDKIDINESSVKNDKDLEEPASKKLRV